MSTIPQSKELAIQKALEEAEKGKFISHDNMRAWFASLGSNNKSTSPKSDVFIEKVSSNEACRSSNY